jgi:hypothetical protein
MDRIPIYTDIENLIEVFSIDRQTDLFYGMKRLVSKESSLTFCSEESEIISHPLFEHLAKEFAAGDFMVRYIDESESFLKSPFKTNLQERFLNKSSILLSNDNNRINACVENNGFLLGGTGQEAEIYAKLNFHKDFFRANRILTIGNEFLNYHNLEPYIMPFTEMIINEPYLFVPERRDFDLEQYLDNNFKALFRSLFRKVKNKVNIVISTFVNEHNQHESNWYDLGSKSFNPLFNYIKEYLRQNLGGARFKLWLIVSPMARQARHDRYILTNYQYIESGAGLTYFDHRGNFINRGEGIHLYSVMHDDARRTFFPSVLDKIQTQVINSIKVTHPNRIFGVENGDSHFLKFIISLFQTGISDNVIFDLLNEIKLEG